MAYFIKLHYGRGECTIETQDYNIVGLQIFYEGSVAIEKTADDSFFLMNRNNMILIFKIAQSSSYLTDLFNYGGILNIKSAIAVNESGGKLNCSVMRNMDYSELIASKAEDMTLLSESMGASYRSTPPRDMKTESNINNLKTSDYDGSTFYLKNGELYSGDYHIHASSATAMTGAYHNTKSEGLYYKKIKNGEVVDKLILTSKPNVSKSNLSTSKKTKRRPLKSGEEIKARKVKKKMQRSPNSRKI